ncbi:choice-of-anchor A family protein [Nocardiopsis protaetiae]|uniref:choice-of-anchor A family protein n=1 Tax=Nocardiopsis protaetiae TaxID=3382270 RepID=UPI00387B3C1A
MPVSRGGDLRTDAGARSALEPFHGFAGTIAEGSAALAARETTGTAERSGSTVTFTSTGGGSLQVFEISAGDIDGASTFLFDASIPADSSILVNVTGADGVAISPPAVGYRGEQADLYTSPYFGEAASRILYNFTDAPSITLSGGGNFLGSILAPRAGADITASTNGRLYLGGDVTLRGSGNETHNYPWAGTPVFGCEPAPEGPREPGGPGVPEEPEEPRNPEEPTAPGEPDAPGERLATTGSALVPLLGGAAVLIVAGTAAVFAARRRRGA